MPATTARLDVIEAQLYDLIPRLTPTGIRRGRPEILPGALLWTGMLRGVPSQRAIWSLLSGAGLWDYPAADITAEAVRIRIQRQGPETMRTLFTAVTAELAAAFPGDADLAPFARAVYALDESTLDGVARTLPALQKIPDGDARLLPGKLITAFDVRAQRFHTVHTTELPRQNERVAARDLVATLPPGSLLLADLGYFSFPWFDELTDGGYFLLSKLRKRTSYEIVHVLTRQDSVTDALIWLGTYRADRAKHCYRLIEVRVGRQVHRYLTNVLDPTLLSARDAVRLYARRWDIELAFRLVKRELGLHLLWSARWEVILTQIWATLLIAQIVSALRAEIARRAGVDLFDVSIALLLRELPRYAARGEPDILHQLIARGPYGGNHPPRPALEDHRARQSAGDTTTT